MIYLNLQKREYNKLYPRVLRIQKLCRGHAPGLSSGSGGQHLLSWAWNSQECTDYAEKDSRVCWDPKLSVELLKAHLWSDFESLEGKVFISLCHT